MSEQEGQLIRPEVEMPEGFISLRSGAHEGRLTRIRTDVSLPPFLGDFGFKVGPVLALARIAGFNSIRIVSNSTESTTEQFGGSSSPDGTLIGNLSSSKTYVPESTSLLDILEDDEFVLTQRRGYTPRGRMWANLVITLNTNEIKRQIVDVERKPANDKKAWAKHMNNTIVEEIFRKGAYHLLRGGDIRNDRDAIITGPAVAYFQEFVFGPISKNGFLEDIVERTLVMLLIYSYIFKWNFRRARILGTNAPLRV